MSADLAYGSVPPIYREIYEILSPDLLNRETFLTIFAKTGLNSNILSQIFDLSVTSSSRNLTRNGVYKTLALCAVAQQGKTVNDKILETFFNQELPKPDVGDLVELKKTATQLRCQNKGAPALGLKFKELNEFDSIKVDLVPEKKGVILKHVEYNVTSSRYKVTVGRRYNDFLTLFELLTQRFPYRIIPALPPKRFAADSKEFIESRRKSLRRFLNIVGKHPVIADDRLGILKFFLTFTGADCQTKLKENFKSVPDEFMTNENSVKAKELVPIDVQVQYANSRTHISSLIQSVTRLKDIGLRIVSRSLELSVDMATLSSELSSMTTDAVPITNWATGTSDTWHHLKKGFRQLASEYNNVSERATKQAATEELQISEELESLLTLLNAYRDLCERHQKGVLHDHQRALNRMSSIKKKHVSTRTSEGSENFESTILEESAIANMEIRNSFSLYCIQMETQLVYSNITLLHTALLQMANVESACSTEMKAVWEKLGEMIGNILPAENGILSPPISPVQRVSSPGPGIKMF